MTTNEITYYYMARCKDCENSKLAETDREFTFSADSPYHDGDCEDACEFTEFEEFDEPRTEVVEY
jgi:hypothetical protein